MHIKLRFGPADTDLEQAVNFLRATAEGHGIALRPATKIGQVAAVYAAEQWCLAHRTRTLEYPAVHGMPAVEALAAVLSRASGRRHTGGPTSSRLPSDPLWEELTKGMSPNEKLMAFERASSDLRFGGSEALADWLTLRLGPASAAGEGTDAA